MDEGSFSSCVLLVFGRILKIKFEDEAMLSVSWGMLSVWLLKVFPFNFCQPFLVN